MICAQWYHMNVERSPLKFHMVKFPYGEISLQRNFLTAKFPEGEKSSRRNFLMTKFPYSQISYGEISQGKISQRRKIRSDSQTLLTHTVQSIFNLFSLHSLYVSLLYFSLFSTWLFCTNYFDISVSQY